MVFFIQILILTFAFDSRAAASGRISELTLKLAPEASFTYGLKDNSNILWFVLPKTPVSALDNLYKYDERLVKRVVIKDTGAGGSEFEIHLKSLGIRSAVNTYDEPKRLVISFFDADYQLALDPVTNLPTGGVGKVGEIGDSKKSPEEKTYMLSETTGDFAKIPKEYESVAKDGDVHKLLQPLPKETFAEEKAKEDLQEIASGASKKWQDYPIYIYPKYLSSIAGYNLDPKKDAASLTPAQSMANYALNLYNFGDESKSFAAYQKVLHGDSSVFEKDPLHLYTFAELNLAHGNFTLADGYFQVVSNRFPESPFSSYAKLRRIDIAALSALERQDSKVFAQLASKLDEFKQSPSYELRAEALLRKAYWQPFTSEDQRFALPVMDEKSAEQLLLILPQVESKKTLFICKSLILRSKLSPEAKWTLELSELADDYFTHYDIKSGKPFYQTLVDLMNDRLAKTIIAQAKSENYIGAIKLFEKLPSKLKEVALEKEWVMWSVAHSYLNTNKEEEALLAYQKAKDLFKDPIMRFKSYFWSAQLSAKLAASTLRTDAGKLNKFKDDALSLDEKLKTLWQQLKDEQKGEVQAQYKAFFEEAIYGNYKLKTPLLIVLDAWTKSLSTQAVSSKDEKSEISKIYNPTSNTVRLLSDLAAKFTEIGLTNERRKTIRLLKQIKPLSFAEDKVAAKLWCDELIKLAEEYHKDNEYLEAGELYTFTAINAKDWDKRAEALYKGGLLLYRAGRRKEAIAALTEASGDGNNLFYANLAKERLVQLAP